MVGVVAALFKSDLRLPEPVYQTISVFLLFGIGLKGGHALKSVEVGDFLPAFIAVLIMGITIPTLAFFTLKFIRGLSDADRGAFAAHYGSTSLVTFTAALLFLESHQTTFEPFATAMLTIMEIPGIVVGIYLGSRKMSKDVDWKKTLIETISGKTIVLLVAGLLVGLAATETGFTKVSPFFIDLQSGVLALFLLHMGYLAGSNYGDIKRVGFKVAIFGITFPVVAGALGVVAGHLAGLSIGGATVLGVLTASASYIAAPAAVALGLPRAKGSLALVSSIGVTFPFNLVLGIPLYLEMAQWIAR